MLCLLCSGVSRYLPAFLNRQFISILCKKGLGIPDHVFKDLQAILPHNVHGGGLQSAGAAQSKY
jgi:hypothetical protein